VTRQKALNKFATFMTCPNRIPIPNEAISPEKSSANTKPTATKDGRSSLPNNTQGSTSTGLAQPVVSPGIQSGSGIPTSAVGSEPTGLIPVVPGGTVPSSPTSTSGALVSDSNSMPLSTLLAILIPVLLVLFAAIGFFVYRRKTSRPNSSPESGGGHEPQILVSEQRMKADLPREQPLRSNHNPNGLPPTIVPISARSLEKKPSDIMEYKTINDIADMYSSYPVASQPSEMGGGTSTSSLKLGTALQGLAASAGIVTAAGLVKTQTEDDVKMDSLDRVHSTAKRTVDSDDIVYQSPGRLSFYPDSESDITSVIPSHASAENLKSPSLENLSEMKHSNSHQSLHRSLYSIPEQSKNDLTDSRFSFMSEDVPMEITPNSKPSPEFAIPQNAVQNPDEELVKPFLHISDSTMDHPISESASLALVPEAPSSVVDSFSSVSTTKPDTSPVVASNTPVIGDAALSVGLVGGVIASQSIASRSEEKQVRFEGEQPRDKMQGSIGKLPEYKKPKEEKPLDPVLDKKAFPVAMITEEPGRFELTKPMDEDDELDDLDNYAPPAPTSHVVIATYYPQNADEMLLQNGDLIGIEKEYGDGWARGQNISQRRKRCVFPLAVLKPITSGPSQAVRRGRGNILRVNRQETDVKQEITIPKRTKSIRRLRRNTRNSLFSVLSSSSEESK
jgi:hypothetical protein